MKLTTCLLLVVFVQASATVFSQTNGLLHLKAEQRTIADILQIVEEQSDYSFMYNSNNIDVSRKTNIHCEGKRIEEVLDILFKGTNVKYRSFNSNYVLYTDEDAHSVEALQEIRITGTVTDRNGEALPGVTVVVKGTTQGVITNADGVYTLLQVNSNATLLFSFVGMKTKEVPVDGKPEINVVLDEETIGVDEVVVVGYGIQKKVNLTGSVGTVSSEALSERPVQNASQILQGLVPGLNVMQSQGGSLDARPEINIRGFATIGEGSTGSPLVLIDGMEGDINALNPQDIENVSVLKDAAASSIYGSRAPFGVILITTKQGQKGRAVVNYNNSFRWSYPINVPDMMDSYTFATYFNEAAINAGGSGYFTDERMQRIKDFRDGKLDKVTIEDPRNTTVWGSGYLFGNDNIDWYQEYFRDYAFSQEHNISANGGNEKMQFYFSGNYLDQGGLLVFSQDDFNRYSTTVKVNGQINDWLSVSVANRFVREDYERPSLLTNTFFMDLARQGWPTISLHDPNGNVSNTWVINLKDGGRDRIQRDWLYQQIKFVLEPVKNWRTHLELNYRTRNNFRHWDTQKTYAYNVAGNPYSVRTATEVYEYALRNNFLTTNIFSEYEKQFASGHHLKGLIGFQAEDNRYRDFSAKRNGVIVASLPVINLTSGTDANGAVVAPSVTGVTSSWSTAGFFGRLNYDYKGRYLLEANLRYDGTSRFREDLRWNWFPSVSAGWNIAREDFWTPLQPIVSSLKLRVSYGELGNQNTSNLYPTYLTMDVEAAKGGWLIDGAKPNIAKAPGLISQSMTWEKIHSWNLGLDMSLLNSRLNSSFDYFSRKTLDMIGPAPELPAVLGTAEPTMNNTDLKTYGFEFSVAWKDRLSNGLAYSVQLMLSDSQTEITRYPNETGSLYNDKNGDGYVGDNEWLYRSNKKIGELWGYETIGIAKTQDEMDAHLATLNNGGQNAIGTQWEAGDIMYKDLNNDGKIDDGAATIDDHGDWKVIGNDTPRYLFSLDLSANWKGFDVRAFFQGVLKRDFFQDSYYFWGANRRGMWWSTGFEEHKDFFRTKDSYSYESMGENLDAYYARPLFSGKNQRRQTRYLQDASYIRLKNLQIGYTIPKHLITKLGVTQLRVFASGENLWTKTKMTKIFDPESVGAGTGSNANGWGGNTYPLSKVFSVGVNVNF